MSQPHAFVALDTETDASPDQRFVCLSAADHQGSAIYVGTSAGEYLGRVLRDPEAQLVLHHAPFDVDVTIRAFPQLRALWIDALAADRVWCTKIRENLIGIAADTDMQYMRARGKGYKLVKRENSLDGLLQRYLGAAPMDKGADGWRLRFGELLGLPLAAWPQRAKDYALGDVDQLAMLLLAQKRAFAHPEMIGDLRISPDEAHQVRAGVALGSMAQRGMDTDPEQAGKLRKDLERQTADHRAHLLGAGLMRAKVKKRPHELSKDAKKCREAVAEGCKMLGIDPPLTETGLISTAKDTLELLAETTPVLRHYHGLVHTDKMLGTYIEPVEKAHAAGQPVRCRYDVLKETGRTSTSKPNVQNLPRMAGMREIYCARPGMALIASDYDTAELRALGQVELELFGSSRFAEFYQQDPDGDPHCLFGSQLSDGRVTYEEMRAMHQAGALGEFQPLRDSAKGMNFGAPGGLGANALVDYLKGYGVSVDVLEAKRLLREWKATWGMQRYFDWVNGSSATVRQAISGRMRGGTSYCSRANTMFQGLIADAAKQAIWDAWTTAEDAWGLWAFIHDELIVEVPLEDVDRAAKWLQDVMVSGASKWVRDVPMRAGAHAMIHWSKKAKRVLDAEGRLIPDPATDRINA